MITDNLANAHLYEKMHSGFKKAFDFLRREDLLTLAPGRYEIEGDNVYALVQEYNSKLLEQGKWETHRNYIDIQFMCEGEELLGYALAERLSSAEPYNSEKDVEFFKGEGSMIKMLKNNFMILYPQDGHMPTIAVDGKSTKVKKTVIKVRL